MSKYYSFIENFIRQEQVVRQLVRQNPLTQYKLFRV